MKGSCLNEDDEVDIITVDKDSTFSDSDISQEELCYLPAHPFPDVPEKLLESNNSGSPPSNDSSKTEGNNNICSCHRLRFLTCKIAKHCNCFFNMFTNC